MTQVATAHHGTPHDAGDETAIAALHAAFACDRNPAPAERRRRIETLLGVVAVHRDAIREALQADFGAYPAPAADLLPTTTTRAWPCATTRSRGCRPTWVAPIT